MKSEVLKNAKFLIIDDEIVNVRVLEQMLEHWGCKRICSTTDPRDSTRLYIETKPDIVLLDLMMPELSGFEVMEQLKPLMQLDGYVPILVLTADTSAEARRRALAVGARDFLTKPFDHTELSLRVWNLVETRFLHSQLRDQNQLLDEKVRERTRQLAQTEIEAAECLAAAAEFRDDDTGQHTERVGRTAAMLAQHLGLAEDRVSLIRRAAPLHDVGKIGISDSILLKPGKLSPEEFDVMKSHAEIGFRILSRHHTPLLQMAATIAHTHHERWDGTGYPHRLKGEDIPLEGRLVAVADVFDALTNERPYKKAWTIEQAVAEIASQSGRQFDPTLAHAFCAHMDEIVNFPQRSAVPYASAA